MEDETTITTDVAKGTRQEMMDSIVKKSRSVQDVVDEDLTQETEEEIVKDIPEEEDDYVVLKVDGQEQRTTKDKVLDAGIRALQKESAADKRLKEAADREAELERRKEELDRIEKQLLSVKKEEPDEVGREFAEALFTDEDKVANTISTLNRKIAQLEGRQEEFSKTEREVLEDKKRERTNLINAATKHFHTNYVDIAEDDEKTNLFNQRLQQALSENPGMPIEKAVDTAAEKYYEKWGGKPVKESSKKDDLIKQPKAASARHKPPPVEKPKTRAERLDEMRRARSIVG